MGVPTHENVDEGVTVIMPVILAPVLFNGAVHVGIFPVPLANIPKSVFEFVHVNDDPNGLLVKLPIFIVAPEHTVVSAF